MTLDIQKDDINQILTINGKKYSYELFQSFANNGMPTGLPFILIDRNSDSGSVMIKKLDLTKVENILKTIIGCDEFKIETSKELEDIKKLYSDLFELL